MVDRLIDCGDDGLQAVVDRRHVARFDGNGHIVT
jgi:hypothetical protein